MIDEGMVPSPITAYHGRLLHIIDGQSLLFMHFSAARCGCSGCSFVWSVQRSESIPISVLYVEGAREMVDGEW